MFYHRAKYVLSALFLEFSRDNLKKEIKPLQFLVIQQAQYYLIQQYRDLV